VVLGLIAAGVPTPAYANTSGTGIVIPLYTYPTSSTWTTIVQTKNSYPLVPVIAIINPGSGPGTSLDPNYVTGISSLQAAGIIVLGYDYTDYGSRSIASVEADATAYLNWYHVNGIFFDQMANVAGYETYYSTLNTFVKSLGMTVTMGNPGTSIPASYVGTLDIINIYETRGTPSLSTLSSHTFYPTHPKSDFSYIAYGVTRLSTSYELSSTTYVGWLYITDGRSPNPYDMLPSYFSAEVSILNR
jgi:Spherulation-specific family 4